MSLLRHSAIAILALLVSSVLQAQDKWDGVLDRYEEICGRCIELRGRITAGDAVPNAEVTGLLGELGRLRSLIQESQGNMSTAQRQRFNSIRSRYEASMGADAGKNNADTSKKVESNKRESSKKVKLPPAPVEPTVPKHPKLPQGSVIPGMPPVGLVPPTDSGIASRSFAGSPSEDIKMPSTPLYGPIRTDIIPIVDWGVKPAFGLFAAVAKEHWGGYLSARSTFTGASVSYSTSSSGNIDGGGKFWGDGNSRYSSWSVSAGPVWHPIDAVGLYVGAGYGSKCLAWQDVAGKWARVTDYSYTGLGIEAGAIFSLHRFDLLAGTSWLGGWSLMLGIGYSF